MLNSITADRKLNKTRRKEGAERTGDDTGSQLKVSEATTMVSGVSVRWSESNMRRETGATRGSGWRRDKGRGVGGRGERFGGGKNKREDRRDPGKSKRLIDIVKEVSGRVKTRVS